MALGREVATGETATGERPRVASGIFLDGDDIPAATGFLNGEVIGFSGPWGDGGRGGQERRR